MRDAAIRIQFLEARLNLVKLPALRFDKGGNCFGGKKRLRPACAAGECVEPFLGAGVEANGENCRHLSPSVYKLPQPHRVAFWPTFATWFPGQRSAYHDLPSDVADAIEGEAVNLRFVLHDRGLGNIPATFWTRLVKHLLEKLL
jgi:hypothetical protein